jgi:hypothetical protein
MEASNPTEGGPPVEVETQLLVQLQIDRVAIIPLPGFLFAEMALGSPFQKRLFPVTEVNQGKTIIWLVIQYSQCAFTIGHHCFIKAPFFFDLIGELCNYDCT